MVRLGHFAFVVAVLVVVPGGVAASPVAGKLELPPAPPRGPAGSKGFVERVENPRKPVRGTNVAPYLLVVLEGDSKPDGGGQVSWDLVGESFARPVVGVPTGHELVIKNQSKTARTLTALEDPKLLPPGPINPTGPKSFRAAEPRIYTIVDKDTPHLRGKVVVVGTPFVATVADDGAFEFSDVPEGSYKLRVFYKDNWIDRPDDTVNVGAKKTPAIAVKLPAGYPLKK